MLIQFLSRSFCSTLKPPFLMTNGRFIKRPLPSFLWGSMKAPVLLCVVYQHLVVLSFSPLAWKEESLSFYGNA